MKTIFFLLAIFTIFLIASPVAATQQGIVQTGKDDNAVQIGGDANVRINHANIDVPVSVPVNVVDAPTINVNIPGPSTSYLSVGDVYQTHLVYPNSVIFVPVHFNESIWVRAGTPVALYTIQAIYNDTVKSSNSIPVYDPVFDKMTSGETPWIDHLDYYTTDSGFVTGKIPMESQPTISS